MPIKRPYQEYEPGNSPGGWADETFDAGGYDDELRVEMLKTAYKDKPEFRVFIDNLTGNERILDAGAGLGSPIVRLLRRMGKINNVVSLDLDFRNLKAQKAAGYPGNHLVLADATKLPFADASFDFISESFLQADNRSISSVDLDREIRRVLKPGGYLISDERPMYGVFKEIVEIDFDYNLYQLLPSS